MLELIDQQARFIAVDITKSFIVQAPAGSGKTSLIIARMLSVLAQVERPENCLAITFTKKAAHEMESRLLELLEKAHRNEATDVSASHLLQLAHKVLLQNKKHGWQLLDNPKRLQIYTIDAFCAYLVRRMPVIAELQGITNVDPAPYYLYEKAAINLIISLLNSDYNVAWHKILLHLDNDIELVKKLLIEMLPWREQWLPLVFSDNKQEFIANVIQNRKQVVVCVLNNLIAAIPQELQDLPRYLHAAACRMQKYDITSRFQVFSNLCGWPAATIENLPIWHLISSWLLTQQGTIRQKLTKEHGFPSVTMLDKNERSLYVEEKTNVQEILASIAQNIKFISILQLLQQTPDVNDDDQELLLELQKILPLLVAELHLVFKENKVVDFSAISNAALFALSALEGADDLNLFLDYNIQHILVDEFQDTSVSQYKLLRQLILNWHEDDNKSLFLVGDPCQSIYSFRQAEPKIFATLWRHGLPNIKLHNLNLQSNFRAQKPLVQWVNEVSVDLFKQNYWPYYESIAYAKAHAILEGKTTITHYTFAGNNYYLEATHIIKLLQKKLQENQGTKIAVLVRSRMHLQDLLPMLRAHNISYYSNEVELLHAKAVIHDLAALTRALMHIGDRIAWLALLRSPLVGLNLRDLTILCIDPELTIWQAIQNVQQRSLLSTDTQTRLTIVVEILQYLLNYAHHLPLLNLIEQAWHQFGGHYLYTQESTLYLQKFFSFLKNYNNEEFNAEKFSQGLAELYVEATTHANARVHVMTIHKAKGLEFDIVVIPGMGRGIHGSDKKLLHWFDWQDCLLLAPINRTPLKNWYSFIAYLQALRIEQESARLLYVAITRAKSELYMYSNEEAHPNSFVKLLGPSLPKCTVFIDNIISTVQQKNTSARRIQVNLLKAAKDMATSINHAQYTPTTLMQTVGTMAHAILYLVGQRGLDVLQYKKTILTKYVRELGLLFSSGDAKLGAALLERFIVNISQCQHARWILDDKYAVFYNEWEIYYLLQQQYHKVIIDRAFLYDDKLWLIDYKVCNNDELEFHINKGRQQLEFYRKVVLQLQQYPVVELGLYFPLQRQLIFLPVCV